MEEGEECEVAKERNRRTERQIENVTDRQSRRTDKETERQR